MASHFLIQEKQLLQKKQKEIEEAEDRKKKVILTFDLVGRKVILNKDDASEVESEKSSILRPSEEREHNRIQPNPTIRIQPVFVNMTNRDTVKAKQHKRLWNGLCLEISGRVQHDGMDQLKSNNGLGAPSSFPDSHEAGTDGDAPECSLDYN